MSLLLYSTKALHKHNSAGKDIQHPEQSNAIGNRNARARTIYEE